MIEFFSNMKLINKLLMLYIITIVMLIGFLSIYTFSELEISAKRRSQEQLQYSCDAFVSDVNFNISILDGIARSVYENYSLKEYVFEHSKISTEELIYFYDYYIKNLERSKNSNPAVYNIRIFLKNKNFLERWPLVYNESRLDGSLIKNTLESENLPSWEIWTETIIPNRPATEFFLPINVVSYVTELKHGNEPIGYLEASMEMSLFFKNMYVSSGDKNFISVYDKQADTFYYDETNEFLTDGLNEAEMLDAFRLHLESTDGYFETKVGRDLLHVSYRYIKPLDVYVFNTVNERTALADLKNQRNTFIAMAVLFLAALYIFTYKIISILLKKLNKIIISMREVKNSNLDVDLDIKGSDEAGELAEHLQLMMERIKVLMSESIKKQQLAKEAEIKALLTQINSHFMNNTLESIRMMAELNDQSDISDSISNLGKLLRYSMNWKMDIVSLEDEVAYAQSYIGLLNIRHDYRINMSISIEDNLMSYKILKMSLQPIIENAIKHGIDPTQADAVIRINAYRQEGFVIIEVSDTGVGIDEERLKLINDKINSKSQASSGDGIGMKNIVERIQTHYGSKYGILVMSKQYCFTKVMLRLPDEETSEREYDSYEKYFNSR